MDLRSLGFSQSIILILLYTMLALVVSRVGDEPAYRALKYGAICGAVGVGLNSLQGLLSPLIPFVFGNTLIVLGSAWILVGVRRLSGEDPPLTLVYVAGAVVAMGGFYWGVFAPNLTGRLTLVNGTLMLLTSATTVTLLFDRRLATIGPIIRWLGAMNLVTTILLAIRIAMHWLYAIPSQDILEQHPANVAVYFTLLLSYATFAMGLNLLVVSRLVHKVYDLATRDALTGALNRAGLQRELQANPLPTISGVLLMDLDHFKRVNDEHGHDVGDRLLQRFTEIVQEHCAPGDLLVRMGGEEFLLLVSVGDPASVAERVRAGFADHAAELQATVSIGVVQLHPGRRLDLRRDLKAADNALYAAKRAGRDRVYLAELA